MIQDIKKVLVANRGEIAVRIIRACYELGIKTVAIFSDVERNALHVKMADEAVCIGPPSPQQSYLNIPAIISAAEITNATAVHPGYGFLSENANFAEACITSGITFIGPTPDNIRNGGDKAKARFLIKKKGVPVVPGSDGIVNDEDAAAKFAKKIGFPVIIKASAGGGGRGMRIVHDLKDLSSAFHLSQREALTAFGNGELYLEKYLTDIHHVEVQIVADHKGNVVHLGERDCSIQRRHQKLIEESPYTFRNLRIKKKIYDAAIDAAKALSYRNVGTIEFIVDKSDNFYFMEINTRVQVEHPVTEMRTEFDLIKEQIRLAAGELLTVRQPNIPFTGHCIECRINAEAPDTMLPSAGKITAFIPPGGPGVRLDTYAHADCVIPPYYDSLIAKLIVKDKDRPSAINRMRRALKEFVIEGIKTNIPIHQQIMTNSDYLNLQINTQFLEKVLNP
jgi:acetyl-CoA carboxylase biotin carboxylase subunit